MKNKFWDPLMSGEHNPLQWLPPMVRYQIMILLAMMWSFIFCAMMEWWLYFPYWIVGHLALLSLGAFITNWTFQGAYRQSHRDLYRAADGHGARHDDLWGA